MLPKQLPCYLGFPHQPQPNSASLVLCARLGQKAPSPGFDVDSGGADRLGKLHTGGRELLASSRRSAKNRKAVAIVPAG